jgi:hypothetical protein
VHHWRCIHGDEEGVDACKSNFAGGRNGDGMGDAMTGCRRRCTPLSC